MSFEFKLLLLFVSLGDYERKAVFWLLATGWRIVFTGEGLDAILFKP